LYHSKSGFESDPNLRFVSLKSRLESNSNLRVMKKKGKEIGGSVPRVRVDQRGAHHGDAPEGDDLVEG